MGYPEQKDPRTGKAPRHQAAANKGNFFIDIDHIPNMPDMTDMDSSDFIIRNDKKYTNFFLREVDLNDYLRRSKAQDVERMFFIEQKGSILGVPDNTKIYLARYSKNSYCIPHSQPNWNPHKVEIVAIASQVMKK